MLNSNEISTKDKNQTSTSNQLTNSNVIFTHLYTMVPQSNRDSNKNQLDKKSKQFISLLENYQNFQFLSNSFPKKTFITAENFQKLKTLFLNFESYTSLMLTDTRKLLQAQKYSLPFKNTYNKVEREVLKNTSLKINKKSEEFYICSLCSHCFLEPVTLSCGCTYCKKCLTEYSYFISEHLFQNSSFISCFNCSKIKINDNFCGIDVTILRLTKELWPESVEVKKLRNEIRNYIIFSSEITGVFHFEKYEYLLNQIYLKDRTNHLLLVDLFLISHFTDKDIKSQEYFNELIELKPSWIIGHYLKFIHNEKLQNIHEVKLSLNECMKLNPSLDWIQEKLHGINEYLKVLNKINSESKSSPDSNCSKNTSLKKKILCKWNIEEMYSKSHQNSQLINVGKRSRSIKSIFDISSDSESEITFKMSRNIHINHQDCSTGHKEDIFKKFKEESFFSEKFIKHKQNILRSLITSSINECLKQEGEKALCDNAANKNNNENKDSFYSKKLTLRSYIIRPKKLACSLCYRLLYKPVTTPCGHTFCRSCLQYSLDYHITCPCCQTTFSVFTTESQFFKNVFIHTLIKTHFCLELEERKLQYNQDVKDINCKENEIPLFISSLVFPYTPCPLHVYQPFYRLMLRRIIASGTKQFGVCMIEPNKIVTEYGSVLKILKYTFTQDGSMFISTVAGRRFNVISVRIQDGYYIASVNWIVDKKILNEQERSESQSLQNDVHKISVNWFRYISTAQKQKIKEIYGINKVPKTSYTNDSLDNGPFWHWFILNILPLDHQCRLNFFANTDLIDRLKRIKRLILIFKVVMLENKSINYTK